MSMPLPVVLAGGVGRNFSPLVTQKTLFPFAGKPLIWYVLKQVKQSGFQRVVVTVNNDNKTTIEAIGETLGMNVVTVVQEEAMGMGSALYAARDHLKGPVIVMNGVDLVEYKLLNTITAAAAQHPFSIVGIKRENYFPGGYLQLQDGRVVGVVEKPHPEKLPSTYVKLVFDCMNGETFLEALSKVGYSNDDSYEQTLTFMMKKTPAHFIPYEGRWSKLKLPYHTLDVMDHIEKKIDRSAQISASAKVINSSIGKNVIVGDGVLIRDSFVEEGSVIGFGTEVARSYVGPHTMTHHAFIGDSVLEGWSNVSYGTCLTNLRMDGNAIQGRKKLGAMVARNVFFGAQSTTLPGVSIGNNVKVYPHAIVHKNLEAGVTLKMYQKQEEV